MNHPLGRVRPHPRSLPRIRLRGRWNPAREERGSSALQSGRAGGTAALVLFTVVGLIAWFYQRDTSQEPDGTTSTATVQRVVDGDTLVLETGDRVRVLGIDSPEAARDDRPAECGADAATTAARDLVEGQSVRLISDPSQADADRYDRLLRYVENYDGTDLSLHLIENGHARVYAPAGDVQRQERYKQAESAARSEGTGLWAC